MQSMHCDLRWQKDLVGQPCVRFGARRALQAQAALQEEVQLPCRQIASRRLRTGPRQNHQTIGSGCNMNVGGAPNALDAAVQVAKLSANALPPRPGA